MDTKILPILLIWISIGLAVGVGENSLNRTKIKSEFHRHYKLYNYNTNNNDDDISLPQLGTLQKFQNLGRAYVIPEGEDFSKFYENYQNITPTAKKLTSTNYPLPYPSGTIEDFQIRAENSTGIEIIVHVLDIDPKIDYLKITTVSDIIDHTPKELVLTGVLKEPLLLRAIGITELKLIFSTGSTDDSHNHQGFLITYKPFGEIPPPVTNPPDVTIPFDELDTISRLLVIQEINQNNITWSNIKEVLCNATNSYIKNTTDIYLEPCYPANVTITKVLKCPKYWPNSLTCIDLNLAITLFKETNQLTTLDPFLEDAMPKTPGGLYYKNLVEMWKEYGRAYMDAAGYPEYNINNTNSELLLWVGIGIGVLLVCFIILFVLLKTGSFRKNWSSLEEEDAEDTKEHEVDITMYPSPDQIVPVLFPTGNIYNNNSSYEIENRNNCINSSTGIRVRTFSESSDIVEDNLQNGFNGNENSAFVGDHEQMEANYHVQINGINKDEAHT